MAAISGPVVGWSSMPGGEDRTIDWDNDMLPNAARQIKQDTDSSQHVVCTQVTGITHCLALF